MGNLIKQFADGTALEYDRGSFDAWCVYYTDREGHRKPPRDVEYFGQLKDYAQKFGVTKVYGDYVTVYDMTGKRIAADVLDNITALSQTYGEDALGADVLFTILYMAMIAEERKENTRLGKRIKRLGIHCLLIENKSIDESANFMRGKGWREISALCEERGF